jgi:acyl-CoA thioesterase FadM
VNLWLRLIAVLVRAFTGARLDPTAEASVLHFRVWPHDLDISLHMNNGRYWTIMDLGRADIAVRSGVWRPLWRYGWMPVVSAGKIRFRRELRLFRAFRLETRIVAWAATWFVVEHRIVAKGRDGADILAAIALTRAGLYDRKGKAFVPVARMFAEVGRPHAESPEPTPEVAAFLAAEEALKHAA